MTEPVENGTRRDIEGVPSIYYDGYWIMRYDPPRDSLTAKKQLIVALTRRLFNHVEHGINVPGTRLAEVRRAYEAENHPERKRVKGTMLAGALFNRATDIFTKLVELQELGVEIRPDNPLMRECGGCLIEALEFGKTVRHRSGAECLDELWGEPFKAFSIPVEAFYESRYIKIAQTMRAIDRIADKIVNTLTHTRLFNAVRQPMKEFAEAAKRKCETLRTDPAIFDVWPSFVVSGERLLNTIPEPLPTSSVSEKRAIEDASRLIEEAKTLITYITRARVPMPKSTAEFFEGCDRYRESLDHRE
ncbi:MAG: hypothetical protein LJE91_07590 [Gammaproteobacteria bacterium]|nr:hypothetical protein [Gammaproteobacteria bacterium]